MLNQEKISVLCTFLKCCVDQADAEGDQDRGPEGTRTAAETAFLEHFGSEEASRIVQKQVDCQTPIRASLHRVVRPSSNHTIRMAAIRLFLRVPSYRVQQ